MRKLTQLQISSLPKMAEKMSNTEIARELQVTRQWVVERLRRLKQAGVVLPVRKRGRKTFIR